MDILAKSESAVIANRVAMLPGLALRSPHFLSFPEKPRALLAFRGEAKHSVALNSESGPLFGGNPLPTCSWLRWRWNPDLE
jgi:hypothetical protein